MADSPLWQLLRQYPEVAHPQCRDIAPLRLVSWVSCEVPARVQQVLHQLMTLFGEVAPVSSNEVLEIGRQQLSWDMIRDALIREATWLLSCNASHYLGLCSPLATQEGDGLPHLTVSKNVLQEVSMEWNIL